MQRCAPRIGAAEAGAAGTTVRAEQRGRGARAGDDGCGGDHQAADRTPGEIEQLTARQRADAARQAAAARAAAEAAAKLGAAQSDRERNGDAVEANRSGPFAEPGLNPPAAAHVAPPAGMAIRPAAPMGVR
jgi:hypothetical protein